MNQETKARLEKLAGIECADCGGSGKELQEGDPFEVYVDCTFCHGTGKRFWPLAELRPVESNWTYINHVTILFAIEQCLGMLGSWRHAHYPRLSTPHWYRMRNLDYNRDHGNPDRLLAALECLDAAIEVEG